MTELEQVKSMLTRAGIGFNEKQAEGWKDEFQAGSTKLATSAEPDTDVEMIFGPDGALLRIEAWGHFNLVAVRG